MFDRDDSTTPDEDPAPFGVTGADEPAPAPASGPEDASASAAGPPRRSPSVPWPVTLALAFVAGALSGVIATYALGIVPLTLVQTAPPRVEVVRVPVEAPGSARDLDDSTATRIGSEGVPSEAAPDPTSPPMEDDLLAAADPRPQPAPARIVARDPDGDPLPPAPAAFVTPRRALVPLFSISGVSEATIEDREGARFEVVGVVAHDAAYAIALVETSAGDSAAAAAPFPLGPAVAGPAQATLLALAGERRVAPVEPGDPEPLQGGPRLRLREPAPEPGLLLDTDGALVGLVPVAGAEALCAHAARDWIALPAAVPLEAFQHALGPAEIETRLRLARKRIAEGRDEDGAREFLEVIAADSRRLAQVRDELVQATERAARGHLERGDAAAARSLLRDVLVRDGGDPDIWALLGRAHAMAGDLKRGVEALLRAADLAPPRADALRAEARGLVLQEATARAARGDRAGAIQVLREMRREFPQDGALPLELGELLLRERRFREAAAAFSEAARDPRTSSRALERERYARDLAGGPGAIAIDYPPGSTDIVTIARIGGGPVVRLRLDEREDAVVLPPSIAERSGIRVGSLPRIRRDARPDAPEVPSLQVSLEVMGVPVRDLPAVLVEGQGGPGADGVLGRAFLKRFRRVQDDGLGRLVLHPR